MMSKRNAENITNSLPSLILNIGGYLKSLISLDNKKELIDNAGGSIGFLIQLFAKPATDKYFEQKSLDVLAEKGFNTYCRAAFNQVYASLLMLKDVAKSNHSLDILTLGLERNFFNQIDELGKKFNVYVFHPKYHPAVQLIKSTSVELLETLKFTKEDINTFKNIFNSSIEKSVVEAFGTDYERHKANLDRIWFQEKETQLLLKTINNSRIGFVENENLKYEDAYGDWLPLSNRSTFSDKIIMEEIEQDERRLKKVDRLIDEYFEGGEQDYINRILFIVADFGKGKSVFLRKYAADLAISYIDTAEGYFPIYFNLRLFSKYNRVDTPYGIIDSFLQREYGINIASDYFRNRKYVFLIDSLDESCDLSKNAIESVMNSITRIQNIDPSRIRTNKLVITSRPFDEVLFNHIYNNEPHKIENGSGGIGAYYLSLYGFKKEQFNDWIYNTLKTFSHELALMHTTGFVKEIVEEITEDRQADVFSILLRNQTLSASELRRPIFAYMIYQLIRNNINVTTVGKIGVYLSFVNLLSKEAKYINDPDLQISLREQFEARNILHHTAALWLYERQQGKGALKKADICRMVGTFGMDQSDEQVIDEYRKSGENDIQFLSHSYFGENDNVLHFQHQSFAEILLAEYFVKVLLKYAIDGITSLDEIVSKLKIGLPTSQSIDFFCELLMLLKETSSSSNDVNILEKRHLLVPLLASVANKKNNKNLNSPKLFFQWYEANGFENESASISPRLVMNWPINDTVINSIIQLCENIINSDRILIMSKVIPITPLINEEVSYLVNSEYESTLIIDKHLALLAGNTLYNTEGEYFIRKFDTQTLIPLLKNIHDWQKNSFRGVRITSLVNESVTTIAVLSNTYFTEVDFSHAIFENCWIYESAFYRCNFQNASWTNVALIHCRLILPKVQNLLLNGLIDVGDCYFNQRGFIPKQLTRKAIKNTPRYNSVGNVHVRYQGPEDLKTYIDFDTLSEMEAYFSGIEFYLKYCLQQRLLSKEDITNAFILTKSGYKERLEVILETLSK